MVIIPAIDIRGGHCVRLVQGDYARERVYSGEPSDVAKDFEQQGATILHVVDLDGAKAGEPQNWSSIEAVVKAVSVPVEVGGGIRSLEVARRLLDAGVNRVVVGTKLVQDEHLSARFFGELGEQVVAGIDSRNGKVAVSGWLDTSSVSAVDLAKRVASEGARRIILTDIGRDGMMAGPNGELYEEVARAVDIPVIHSGGVGSLDHLRLLAGLEPQPEGVIVGRALYEGRFTVQEALGAF